MGQATARSRQETATTLITRILDFLGSHRSVTALALVAGLVLAGMALTADGSARVAAATARWKMEGGTVTLHSTLGTPTFSSVTFRQVYDAPPLVFAIANQRGGNPSAVRIRNVTTTGFEAAQVEPAGNDGPHLAMAIHYLAVEPGIHELPDGTLVEAGTVATTTVQHGWGVAGAEGWDTLDFSAPFSTTPALLVQIQDMANEAGSPPGGPSVPWLTTAVRNVSTTVAEFALERSEANDGAVNSLETIAYVAIEGGALGTFPDNSGTSVAYEAIVSGPVLDGWDNGCDQVSFAGSYASLPLVVASKSTHNGGDGGWLRRCSLSTTGVGLTVDEDQDRDLERSHTKEAASIVAFSQAFDAALGNTPPVANDDAASTSENAQATIDVTSNDSDADGNLDPTSVAVIEPPASGSASIDPGTGEATYAPGRDFAGVDSFSYQVCDYEGDCDTATVTVTVAGQVPRSPAVADDDKGTETDVTGASGTVSGGMASATAAFPAALPQTGSQPPESPSLIGSAQQVWVTAGVGAVALVAGLFAVGLAWRPRREPERSSH